MLVSLILPSYKRAELLDLNFQALLKNNSLNYGLEIIVLNDYLEDRTKEVCLKYQDILNIRYFFTGKRNLEKITSRVAGFALNIGVKQALGEIIVLSCPEVFQLNNALDILVEATIKNPKSMVIPEYVLDDRKNSFTQEILKDVNFKISEQYLNCTQDDIESAKMPFFMGMWKKEYLERGGYNEEMTGYAADDNEFITRLEFNGLNFVRVPSKVVHLWHGNHCDGQLHWDNPAWVFNYKIFQNTLKNKIIKSNVGKEWGVL